MDFWANWHKIQKSTLFCSFLTERIYFSISEAIIFQHCSRRISTLSLAYPPQSFHHTIEVRLLQCYFLHQNSWNCIAGDGAGDCICRWWRSSKQRNGSKWRRLASLTFKFVQQCVCVFQRRQWNRQLPMSEAKQRKTVCGSFFFEWPLSLKHNISSPSAGASGGNKLNFKK